MTRIFISQYNNPMKNLINPTLLLLLIITATCSPGTTDKTSPTDQQLVYIASRGNGFDIYKSNQDGSDEIQLTTQKGFDWGPRWWEARQGLIHYEQDTANNFSLRLISSSGEPMTMDFQGLDDFIASPDGMFALYTEKAAEYDHIFMQDLKTKTATDLTPYEAYHGRPHWSPDSQSVLLLSDRSGSTELYLYKLENQSLTQLTDGEGRVKYVSWAPDGQQVAFTREVLEAPKKDHDIFILNLESKAITQLTDTPFGEQEISWSPIGDKIAYHGTIDGKDDIYTIDIKSKEVIKITNGQGYHGEPTWIPVFE